MRTAFCLSGHIRCLEQNIDSIKKNILSCNGDVDIFIHTWDTYGWRTEGYDITKEKFKGFDYHSGQIDVQSIIEVLKPKKIVVENYSEVEDMILERASKFRNRKMYYIDRPENLVSMTYKVFQCNSLKTEVEVEEGFKYDIVVRTRPDFNYHSLVNFGEHNIDLVNCLNKHCGDGICDVFAFSNSENMDIYSNAYNCLESVCSEDTLPIGDGRYRAPNSNTSTCNPHDFYLNFIKKYLPGKFTLVDLPMDILRTELDSQRYNI